jgi:hypothetical protein
MHLIAQLHHQPLVFAIPIFLPIFLDSTKISSYISRSANNLLLLQFGITLFIYLASIGVAVPLNRNQIPESYPGDLPPETCGHNQHSDLRGSEDDVQPSA